MVIISVILCKSRPQSRLIKAHTQESIYSFTHACLLFGSVEGYGSSTLNPLRKASGIVKGGSEFPLILGRDFSGVVVATGRGVPKSHFKPGDEVNRNSLVFLSGIIL